MTEVDFRSLPFPESLKWLRENGEPAEARPDVDTESLRRRFPHLGKVSVSDLIVESPHGPQPARVYRDPTAEPSGKALVWVHGGAFLGGYLDMPESNWVALELAARGIAGPDPSAGHFDGREGAKSRRAEWDGGVGSHTVS